MQGSPRSIFLSPKSWTNFAHRKWIWRKQINHSRFSIFFCFVGHRADSSASSVDFFVSLQAKCFWNFWKKFKNWLPAVRGKEHETFCPHKTITPKSCKILEISPNVPDRRRTFQEASKGKRGGLRPTNFDIFFFSFLLPDRRGADFANPPFLFEGQNVNFFQCVKHSEAGEYFVCITGVFIDTDPADPVEVRRLRSSPKCCPPLLAFL